MVDGCFIIAKTCSICKRGQPVELFCRNSLAKDGLDTRCRPCNNKRCRDRRNPKVVAERKRVEQYKKDHPAVKTCSGCKKFKKKSEFSKNIRKSDNLSVYCKPCQRQKGRESHYRHREKNNDRSRKYRIVNFDKISKHQKEYRIENADKVRETNRRWREKNRDKERDYKSKRRALRRGGDYIKYDRATIFKRDNGICCICQKEIDIVLRSPHRMSFTIQHLRPLSLGGADAPYNVAPAHYSCNSSIGNRVVMS